MDGMNPDQIPNMSQSPAESLAVIASTMLEMVRTLGRIEERLGHLEVLAGYTDEGLMDVDTQSVMKRSWDAHGARWVYGAPEV